jgi:glycosyltransferase involved in cell wall biosynthesis
MISVIIPFYNAAETLPRLLRCLAGQDLAASAFEVLLIDNKSSDNSVALIEAFRQNHPQMGVHIYHYGDRPSSYGARNVGVAHARGDMLAFTDADCAPTPQWLAEIEQLLSVASKTVLAGNVELEVVDPKNYWEAFDKSAHMNNERKAANANVVTANMAVLKSDFGKIGGFLEIESGADYAWSQAAQSQGFEVRFHHPATVLHPTRKSFHELQKKLLRVSRGQAELAEEKGQYRPLAVVLYIARIFFPSRSVRYVTGVARISGPRRAIIFWGHFMVLSAQQVGAFIKQLYQMGLK